jgi:hypothetical protein
MIFDDDDPHTLYLRRQTLLALKRSRSMIRKTLCLADPDKAVEGPRRRSASPAQTSLTIGAHRI